MKKVVFILVKINDEVFEWRKRYEVIILKYPLLDKSLLDLQPLNGRFYTYIAAAQISTKELTKIKEDKRVLMIEVSYSMFVYLNQYAKNKGISTLYNETLRSKSSLERMNEAALTETCRQCVHLCEKYTDNWGEIGITQDSVDEIVTAVTDFEKATTEISNARINRRAAIKNLDDLANENLKLLNDRIRPLVKAAFQNTNPEAFATFENILSVNQEHNYKQAVRGQIVDAATGEPIKYPIIEIEKIGLRRRLRSEKGNFIIRNLEPGEYIIRCTHAEYKTISYKFIHAWGDTNELTIRMERVVVETTTQQPEQA